MHNITYVIYIIYPIHTEQCFFVVFFFKVVLLACFTSHFGMELIYGEKSNIVHVYVQYIRKLYDASCIYRIVVVAVFSRRSHRHIAITHIAIVVAVVHITFCLCLCVCVCVYHGYLLY